MSNVVMFTDAPSADWFSRGYGAYRLASEVRKYGFTAITVDFASTMNWETFTSIIDKTVTADTLVVGFSTTWFPYRHKNLPNPRYVVGFKSLKTDPTIDYMPESHKWYEDSVAYGFSGKDLDKYVNYIKKINPKVKVIAGGAKAYEYVFEESLDNIFVGYSENQFIDYLKSVSKTGTRRIFNKIIDYDPKAQIGEFDFNNSITHYVDTDCLFPQEVLTIEFSRGCIFNCTFCSYPHKNQDTRNFVKYQEIIRKELMDNWTNWGVYKYVITDDTFNDYTEKLVLINEVIQSLPFKPHFWAYIRQDLVSRNPEQAQLIKDIGIKETYYGLETWSEATGKAIRKGGNLNKKIEGMRICKEVWGDSVYSVSGIVVGLPQDTVQSINDSVKWYQEEGHKYIDLFGYGSLTLRDFGDAQPYIFMSDIEKDMGKWGYKMIDPDNKPLEWLRSDAGDINSKSQADKLMESANAGCSQYWNQKRVWDWSQIFVSLNFDLNRSSTDLVYEFTNNYYFPKLLEKLR